MIFVTVGTHEQKFNRLLEKIDKLKEENTITEDVIVQYGYSDFIPKYCISHKMLTYEDMNKYINEARIVITHGGPASFIMPITIGKVPIVVPRQKKYGEHVNNHQLEFVKKIVSRNINIIPIYDINDLENAIVKYDDIAKDLIKEYKSNNDQFKHKLEREIKDLFE